MSETIVQPLPESQMQIHAILLCPVAVTREEIRFNACLNQKGKCINPVAHEWCPSLSFAVCMYAHTCMYFK